MLKRAQARGFLSIDVYNQREQTTDTHKTADDRPYGGGPGMVLKAEPILETFESIQSKIKRQKLKIQLKNKKLKIKGKGLKILILSPRGKTLTNEYAHTLVKKYSDLVFIAGHYEGIDARVKKILKAEELSIGPYVLTGGELPAMVVIDCMARQIPGVLGKNESLEEGRLASSEVYTRPEIITCKKKNYRVPKVLLSGNHKEIEAWKKSKK